MPVPRAWSACCSPVSSLFFWLLGCLLPVWRPADAARRSGRDETPRYQQLIGPPPGGARWRPGWAPGSEYRDGGRNPEAGARAALTPCPPLPKTGRGGTKDWRLAISAATPI